MLRSKPFLFLFYILIGLVSCNQSPEVAIERRIQNIENGLLSDVGDPPWKRMSLVERMAYYNVPGVSIAAINNNQLEWVKGYGVREAGSEDQVTPETLFQAASISKMPTAVATLQDGLGYRLTIARFIRGFIWTFCGLGFAGDEFFDHPPRFVIGELLRR